MTALPEAFARRMRAQLGAEADAYFAALEAPYARGLRLNPFKSADPPLAICAEGRAIAWEPLGRYVAPDDRAGALALHEAGAYYLQEPSAMIPARALAPQPGDTVLDLCAAPGGKSTQLAAMLAGEGLLVCNEPVPSRAQVLSRNIERMGVPNALVVSALPEKLAARWPNLFDAILVDAPCSGEGMFRRHPETRLEWREDSPAGCAARQRDILASAVRMLRPGGRLCYSTCTFSEEEDERVIAALLAAHPELRPVPFTLPGLPPADAGMLKLYPHRVCGEGHFVALLQKANNFGTENEIIREGEHSLVADASHEVVGVGAADVAQTTRVPQCRSSAGEAVPARGAACGAVRAAQGVRESTAKNASMVADTVCPRHAARPRANLLPADQAFAPVSKAARAAFDAFCAGADFCCPYAPTAGIGDALVGCPPLPDVSGLRVLRAGVRLGECRGGRFEPDHALAMALRPPYPLPTVALTEAQAQRYLQGEALSGDELTAKPRGGYLLAVYRGLALGWAKYAGEQLKNHYPKGLRRAVRAEDEA